MEGNALMNAKEGKAGTQAEADSTSFKEKQMMFSIRMEGCVDHSVSCHHECPRTWYPLLIKIY